MPEQGEDFVLISLTYQLLLFPAGASSVPSPRACSANTAHSQLWAGQESCCCCLTGAQIQQNAPSLLCSSCPQAQNTLFSHFLAMKHFVGFVLGFLAVVLVCLVGLPQSRSQSEAGGQDNTPGPFHFTLVSSPSCHCHHRRPQGGGLGMSCSLSRALGTHSRCCRQGEPSPHSPADLLPKPPSGKAPSSPTHPCALQFPLPGARIVFIKGSILLQSQLFIIVKIKTLSCTFCIKTNKIPEDSHLASNLNLCSLALCTAWLYELKNVSESWQKNISTFRLL